MVQKKHVRKRYGRQKIDVAKKSAPVAARIPFSRTASFAVIIFLKEVYFVLPLVFLVLLIVNSVGANFALAETNIRTASSDQRTG